MNVRHRGSAVLVATVLLALVSLLLYRLVPMAGAALGFGSGLAAAVVMAHLGALAALMGPFVALRRRLRGRETMTVHNASERTTGSK